MSDEFPIGLYRRTTAHWSAGKVTTLFVKQSGQGSKLVLEQSNETTVTLGGEFTLVLSPVEEAEPPIIGIPPEFPELPTPEPEPPVGIEPPIYKPEQPPAGVEPPIYNPDAPGVEPPIYKPEVPGAKPKPPIYEKPAPPVGVEPPMYEKPDKPEPK